MLALGARDREFDSPKSPFLILTGMAQGKRAGLITPRSSDRNGLPVKSLLGSPPDSDNFQPTPLSSAAERGAHNPRGHRIETCRGYKTGMAQGQRAGLITLRSSDRNGLSVFSLNRVRSLVMTVFNRCGAEASARGS